MKKLLMVMVLVASAVAASAQSLQPQRRLGSRLARSAQTVSQNADAAKDREARKVRAAQRSQFSAGSLTAEFERERDTLFMDIVREAEICQTNLAEYATYPYWPDAMGVVSNFCARENCVVVDVGHHFGSWRRNSWWQGRGKRAYVVRSNMKAQKRFVPSVRSEGAGGFRLTSRGGAYTNGAFCATGPICCYDSAGRFVEMYDSVDKIPGMKRCFDDELKVNYAEQDRWMKAHGFSDEGSGREAENRLDAARTNVIGRLNSLRTILSSFPQWRSDNKWYGVCNVGADKRGPSALRGLRRPSSKPSISINTNDVVLVRMNERFECLGRKQDKLIEMVVRDLTGLEFGSPANTNGVLDLKFNLGCYETCTFGTSQGDVNRVTLIAESDPSYEQKTIHEKLDQGLSVLLPAIGMDSDALTYNESTSGARPLLGRPRRQDGNQDWKSVQSFSRRFTISRNKKPSGEYGVTISDERKVEVPTVNENARQTGFSEARYVPAGCSVSRRRRPPLRSNGRNKRHERLNVRRKPNRRKAEREAERAEQRQQLLAIQEELKRVREAKAAESRDEGGKVVASCATSKQTVPSVRKKDFKAKLTGIAIIEGGRMCGYEARAKSAEFQSPDRPMEIPYGKAACFRVEYDFPEGYQARVWTRDRWQKGEDGSSYYFGSNPSPLYNGKGVAYGFLDMLERGKTCTLKQLAIQTIAEPKLEELPKGWDIVVTPVDIKFHGPETTQKVMPKGDEKVISNNQPQGTNMVADKLQSCDFLLNKGYKKNAKVYLCLFSASWCGPCRAEMPRIAKTYAETLKDDPDIELIHFSRDRDEEKALAWAKEHDVKFPVVKPNGGNSLDLHSRGIPHLFIVKADGTLVEEGHPMRIFNEEKFREIKSGNVKPRTSEGTEQCQQAYETTTNGVKWSYKIVDGGVVFKGGYCSGAKLAVPQETSGALVIPDKLGGYPVRSIDEAAFRYCRRLTSVTIPSTVTSIKGNPFSGCSGIESFVVSPDNPMYSSVNGLLCTKDGKMVIAGVKGDLKIPEGVTSIGKSAFYAYWGLKSVSIPPSVKKIEPLAFYNSGLTSVTIPEGVVSIGNSAFGDCWGMTSVTIPASVTSIGDQAFSASSGKMKSISVSQANTKYASLNGLLCSKDGKTIIAGIDGDVTIPEGVTSIDDWAFYKCSGLMSVQIPSSVARIGKAAFDWCTKIRAFRVSAENTEFASPNGLLCSGDGKTLIAGVNGNVVIPDGVTKINESAFSGRRELTAVTIPASVSEIGTEAFRCCSAMTSVKLRGERPNAGKNIFSDCDKLKSIHVPDNVKSWAGMKEWQGKKLIFGDGLKTEAEKISVAEKLGECDFLLNKDFKKNAKFYLCLFSASWCPPCRREMPRIAETYAETLKDDSDIELIHFSCDQNDEKALAWAKEHGVKFPVVKPKGGNPLDLHTRGIPHLFIVKADGTLVEEGHPMRIFNEEKFKELKSK